MDLSWAVAAGALPSLCALVLCSCGRSSLGLPDPPQVGPAFERCPASGVIPLAQADAEIVGAQEPESAGSSVAGAGDVNGDGFDDLILGAPRAGERGAGGYPGAAYLFYGPVRGALSVLDADAVFLGEPGSWAGRAVAGAGDVNGDGFDDLLIGADLDDEGNYEGTGGAGAAYLVYGPVFGTVQLADADAKLIGEGWKNGAGLAVAGAGDVNGDGLGDLIIGAPRQDRDGPCGEAGAAYLIYGPVMGKRSLSLADATMRGGCWDFVGGAVAAAGDVDADGYADVLVGAPESEKGGIVYLVRGPVVGAVDLSTVAAALVAEDSDDFAGYALAGGYDVDGDAVPDIVVGAWGDDSSAHWAGAAYLFTGSVLGAHNLSEADAKFFGLGQRQLAGISVASVGDFNGDGLGDLMVGSVASAMPGSAYLLYGPLRDSLSLAKAPVSFIAETKSDYTFTVAGIGDLNGDGFADIAVGSPFHDGAARGAGAVYVFYGCR
jgi:hypothetical protein